MRVKKKYSLSKDMVKVFSLNAVATLVKMLSGLISVKLVSVLIGPSGIALLGQLNNFSSIFLTLSTGGINSGITKYIAENVGNQNHINTFVKTSIWITLVCSLVCGVVLFLGAEYFAKLILHDIEYRSIIKILGCTLVLYALNALLVSIINGYKEFKNFVRVNIAGSVVSMFFSAIMVYFFHVYGALLAAVTFQSVVLVITVSLVAKSEWFKKDFLFGTFDSAAAKKLAHYSLMALVSAFTIPVSQLIIRNYMAENISLTAAGIWEGMNRISAMYLMVITTSLSVYYLPRLAEIKTAYEMKNEVLSVYKLVIPMLLASIGVIYIFRDFIIHILFNREFESMRNLFVFALAGDFFKIVAWVLAYNMLAKSMTRIFVITEIAFSVSLVLLAFYFIDAYGYPGATMAYAVNYFGYMLMMLMLFKSLFIRG